MDGGTERSARWRALGCDVDLAVTDEATLSEACRLLAADLQALDLAASRFRADSEVARLAVAGGRPVAISPLLADLIEVALAAAERTDGDLDPTLGTELMSLGYDRDFAALACAERDGPADPRGAGHAERFAPEPQLRVRRSVRWSDVDLDRAASTVRVPAGTVLDLGATAKACAADLSAARLARELGCGVLVALGGDVAVAGEPPDGGWIVRVQDVTGDPACPAPSGSTASLVALTVGGLATSSTAARRWRHAGSLVHHILDPRTGRSAAPVWHTVSVSAATCTEANVASTTAIIRGLRALRWLGELELPARLVPAPGGSFGTEPVLLGGWPREAEVA